MARKEKKEGTGRCILGGGGEEAVRGQREAQPSKSPGKELALPA